MPAFSDSTRSECGIAITSSASAISSLEMPCAFAADEDGASLRQVGFVQRNALVGRRGQILAPCSRRFRTASADSIFATGKRNREPAEARMTFGLMALTVPSMVKTPDAPIASAERMIVPRFPGPAHRQLPG